MRIVWRTRRICTEIGIFQMPGTKADLSKVVDLSACDFSPARPLSQQDCAQTTRYHDGDFGRHFRHQRRVFEFRTHQTNSQYSNKVKNLPIGVSGIRILCRQNSNRSGLVIGSSEVVPKLFNSRQPNNQPKTQARDSGEDWVW